jgi:hypothetical protein
MWAQVVELARGIEQRLGRNAADVEAGAAQRRLAVLARSASMQAVADRGPSCAARIAAT